MNRTGVFAPPSSFSNSAECEKGTLSALEATQGQIDGFFSQLPYKCYQYLWEIDLRFAPGLPAEW